jgi:hypothetical protein
MIKNVIYGHAESFYIFFYVVVHHLMEKIKNKSCKKLPCSLFNLQVKFINNILDNIWSKRSTKAKQLVLRMLSKRPEDRPSA